MLESTSMVLLHEALTRCKGVKGLAKILDVEATLAELESSDLVPTHEGDFLETLGFATAILVNDNSFNIEGINKEKKLVVY